MVPFLRGQTTSTYAIDDETWWRGSEQTTVTIASSMDFDKIFPTDTPEERANKTKQIKAAEQKAIKRKVLGPKRSRWG